jgi:hypothetical protein
MFESGSVEGDSTPSSTGPPTGSRHVRQREREEQAVRTYDDLVEVRKGPLDGLADESEDGPEQFLWRGRLWQVREVIAHWVETGAWWIRRPEDAPGRSEITREREVWRVAAARGRAVSAVDDPGFGVFDLAFDWSEGVWRLAGSVD